MAKIKEVDSSVDGEQPVIVVLDDGTEVNLSDIDGGFMRQKDYTKKTQSLADQKKALEQAEANQQVNTAVNSQPDVNDNSAEVTKMYLGMKMTELKNIHGEGFDEVAVLNKAADMLSKGISPTDIDFNFIAKGLQNNSTNEVALREQIKNEILAELKGNNVDTSSVISSMDSSTLTDETYGLSQVELNYCTSTGEDPKVYAEWLAKLKR
jgi:hypothetical protein